MLTSAEITQLIQSLIWLLAGVMTLMQATPIIMGAYISTTETGLERVADHIVNVGYSICNPVGDDKENDSVKG